MSAPKPPFAFTASGKKQNLDEFAADLEKTTTLTKMQIYPSIVKRFQAFIEAWDGEDCLSIYLCTGHSMFVDGFRNKFLVAGQADGNGLVEPCFNWLDMSAALEHQAGDVLNIFDSCYPAQLNVNHFVESLAAANGNSIALPDNSFTKTLRAQLKVLNGSACTISQLYGDIHKVLYNENAENLPFHVAHLGKNSIILQKLQTRMATRQSTKGMRKLHIRPLAASDSRALVSVRLQESTGMNDLKAWRQWLADTIPTSVHPSQFTIEGQFGGDSVIVLVAMPVAVWTCLPQYDTAYGFVSFLKGGRSLLL